MLKYLLVAKRSCRIGFIMGWLRSVGSIKLNGCAAKFAEYHLFNRALLQKRPIILSILLTEATPYSKWLSRSFPPDQDGQAEMICTS